MMKTNIKKTLITITTTLSAILIVTTATYAIGTLTPSGTAGDDTQYSLNDIYDKLTNFSDTPTSTSSPFTVPSVSASFRTLSEIYSLLQAEEADLVAENIKDGTTIFGVTGNMSAGVVYPTEWSVGYVGGSYNQLNWADAVSYCDGLVENDHSDWRLPTYQELVNVFMTTYPANSLGFGDFAYWSIGVYPNNSNSAMHVYMTTGYSDYSPKTDPDYHVRCVR